MSYNDHPMSDPLPIAYALLAAGIAETVAGILAVIRGGGYPAYVTSMFGIWLLGFLLLATIGTNSGHFTPDAFAWYLLMLVIPLAIMSVPALVHRNAAFSLALSALTVMLLLAGIGFLNLNHVLTTAAAQKTAPDLSTAVDLVKASVWCSFVAAACIWWVFAVRVFELTGVRGAPSTTTTAATSDTHLGRGVAG